MPVARPRCRLRAVQTNPSQACGGADGFADTQHQTLAHAVCPMPCDHARGRRGQCPQSETDRIRPFRAIAIHHPARRDLQQRIRPEEGGVQQPAAVIVETIQPCKPFSARTADRFARSTYAITIPSASRTTTTTIDGRQACTASSNPRMYPNANANACRPPVSPSITGTWSGINMPS